MRTLFALLICFLSFSTFAQKINSEESEITFSVYNMTVNEVEGTMTGLSGDVNFDPDDPSTATFDVELDASTVFTSNKLRDRHLRNKKNLFYVELFPTLKFKSTEIIENSDYGYTVVGTLTIRDMSKEVRIPFKMVEKDNKIHLKGDITLNRLDYGLGEGIKPMMISEDIEATILCVLDRE